LLAKGYLTDNRTLTIRSVCSSLELARSSFYAAKKAKKKNDRLDYQLWRKAGKVWKDFPGWGYRKLAVRLKVKGKKTLRILNKYRSLSKEKNKRGNQEDKGKKDKGRKYPNLIKKILKDLLDHPKKQKRKNWIIKDGKNKYRKILKPTRPYQLWAGDWKELKIPLLGTTLYIFITIDCYTRQVMGFSLSLIKDGKTAVKASQMAIDKVKKDPLFNPRSLIMHTDQGSAYLSEVYEIFWKKLGVSLSTADKGKPTQNPYAEAFISLLVRFCLSQYELLTIADVKQAIVKFIKLYNSDWIHGEIGNMAPNQKLEQYRSYLKF